MKAFARVTALATILVGISALALLAADAAYMGKWRLNPAKSDFGETTVTYEPLADRQLKITSQGQSYTVGVDGKDYPTPWGNTVAWKAVDASTWEVIVKTGPKVIVTMTLKLGADGKTLTADSRVSLATGGTSDDTAVYQRTSGGPGLAGAWKTKNVEVGSPGTMTLSANGPDGVTLTFVEEKGVCSAKFDGKDHPATGPMWPSGWTCAIASKGPTGLEVTWKKDGKLMFTDTMTPSADGRTLTDVGRAGTTSEKVTTVYDRQ
jgi:hypothetical protein